MEQNDRPEALEWTRALDKAGARKPAARRQVPVPEPSKRPAKSPLAASTPTRPDSSPPLTVKKPGENSAWRPAGLTSPPIKPNGIINRPPIARKGIVHGRPINPQTTSPPPRTPSAATQGPTEFNLGEVVERVLAVVERVLMVVVALFFFAWIIGILDSV